MAKQTTTYLRCVKSLTSNYMPDSTINTMKSLVRIPMCFMMFSNYDINCDVLITILI